MSLAPAQMLRPALVAVLAIAPLTGSAAAAIPAPATRSAMEAAVPRALELPAGDHPLGWVTTSTVADRTYGLSVDLRGRARAVAGRAVLSLTERSADGRTVKRAVLDPRAIGRPATLVVTLRARRSGDAVEAHLTTTSPASARYEIASVTGARVAGKSSLSVSPSSATLLPGQTKQFSASLGGAPVSVTWRVDGVVGGSSASGRISAAGLYVAPATPPSSGVARVRATTRTGRYSEASVTLAPAPAPAPAPVPPPAPAPEPAPSPAPPPSGTLTMVSNPIASWKQTILAFGQRSHWIQPTRGYLDTPPASRLRDAIGINFNLGADEADKADATARLLAESGVRRARVEIAWNEIGYDDTSQLWRAARYRMIIAALVHNGIRPLILLNSNHGIPGPRRPVTFTTTAPAAAGARTVQLDGASAAQVVPRRSGLDSLTTSKAAEVIFTAVDANGVATLARPLPVALAAGAHTGSLLRYEPFSRPVRADGTPDPRFEATLAGWLDYVRVVTGETRSIVGSDAFDVEVWNEMSFGSDFLDVNRYYDPATDTNPGTSADTTTRAILERTIAWIRDPAHGVAGIGIGNGFANQRPWEAGSTSPAGLTAIDKHPYPRYRVFPQDSVANGVRPVDALGVPEGVKDASGNWVDSFTPTYTTLFPEYFLTAIQTEHLVRDVSPITTTVYGTAHGRLTAPLGGTPPQVWLTEINTEGVGHVAPAAFTRFQAKALLRTLLSYTSAGVTAIDMFAARGFTSGEYGLVDPAFYTAVAAGAGAYPGTGAGGIGLDATRRMTTAIPAGTITRPRMLSLLGIGDYAGRTQFSGDGTPAHPALYDRDVATVLPFQVSDTRFVLGAYVATRDLSKVHDAAAPTSDARRYDLPAETYRLRIGGVEHCPATVSATDPLDGAAVPVTVISCAAPELTLEMPLTDSPRIISIDGA